MQHGVRGGSTVRLNITESSHRIWANVRSSGAAKLWDETNIYQVKHVS